MRNDFRTYYQMTEIILLELEGKAGPEQFSQLTEWLKTNPDAVDFYVEMMMLYSGFTQPGNLNISGIVKTDSETVLDDSFWQELSDYEKHAPEALVTSSSEESNNQKVRVIKVPQPERKVNKFSLITAVCSLAAMILMIAYVKLNPHPSVSVGYLSSTINAVWSADHAALREGDNLLSGTFTLEQGLAEFVLDSGARMVLQGPAKVHVESPKRVFLNQGSASFLVHHGGEPFVVRTPKCSVVDYGTEFGVSINAEGLAETHVFQGEVELRSGTEPLKYDQSLRLLAGQAGQIKANDKLESIRCDKLKFVALDEYETRLKAKEGSDYNRWKSFVYTIHRDPSLLAHYFYEQPQGDPERLINYASNRSEMLNGTFGDTDESKQKPTWVQGRWPQKDAVLFERDKKQVILIPPQDSLSITYPLTISAWVYFPHKESWGGHLISCREGENINYQFSLFDENYTYGYQKGRFEFRQYTGSENDRDGFYSKPFRPEPQKWYHLAVVYDGAEVRFYINGAVFQSASYKGKPEPVKSEIILGAMKKDGYILESGDFDGVVDEMMIFNRTMEESEIRQIYQAGKP